MGTWLTPNELSEVVAAETGFPSPVPTQIVSNGEFNPLPQTAQQKQVEALVVELADASARKLRMERRQFLKTASGMAAAFLAMNQVYGPLFDVGKAEAADLDAADERARKLAGQFIFDDQVHFVRDDYKFEGLLDLGKFASKHWNPGMLKDLKIELLRYKFENF